MTDRPDNQLPVSDVPPSDELPQDEIVYSEMRPDDIEVSEPSDEIVPESFADVSVEDEVPATADNGSQPPPSTPDSDEHEVAPDEMGARLERLGGEPAPDISPEEFARLQQSGQIHIDPRGRVRSARQHQNQDAGVSLRKRRAWYQ
jgi:hypothetical protein